jgi:hypothetical protein
MSTSIPRTVTLTAPTTGDDDSALVVTPKQAARLLFEMAGYAPDTTDAEVWTCGLDGTERQERGLASVGGVADLLDDGYPWSLVPSDDGGVHLQRFGPDDSSGVWLAVVAG